MLDVDAIEFPKTETPAHFGSLSDPDRLASVEQSGLMDSLPQEAFDRFVRLASSLLDGEASLISIVDDKRQFFKAHTGLPEAVARAGGTPVSESLCQYVVAGDAPLAVSDTNAHELLRENASVKDLGISAYMGVPIHTPDGQPIGSFCVLDNKIHRWTDEQLSILQDLAASVENEIRLRQLAEVQRMLSGELDHRVKNVFSILSGMISMTARNADSVQEMGDSLRGRVQALAKAHDLIRPAITAGEDERTNMVSLQQLVSSLIEPHLAMKNERLTIDGPSIALTASSATNIALVLHELATNAAKYGALSVSQGWLEISWSAVQDDLILNWSEYGGPEVPTKPSSIGFGSQLIDMTISRQLRGALTTQWARNGVRHELKVPLNKLQDR